MNFTIQLALWGWVPFGALMFALMRPRWAVMVCIFGAWMFLPMYTIEISSFPNYDKTTAGTLAAILGSLVFDQGRLFAFKPRWFDLPIVIFVGAQFTAALNAGSGVYEGVTDMVMAGIGFGLPYYLARVYFTDLEALKDLALGFFIAGLIYLPLCLYEIRMSPQLHADIYGFFPHSWGQMERFGGFRPIVFMQHGLAVAGFMAFSTVVGFGLWRSGHLKSLYGVPPWVAVLAMAGTTILCKSGNALVLMTGGVVTFELMRWFETKALLLCLILVPPAYMAVRAPGLWDGQELIDLTKMVSDARAGSLYVRIHSENVLLPIAMEKPLFGHGHWAAGLSPEQYENVTPDGYWLITIAALGAFGLAGFTLMFLLPGLRLVRAARAKELVRGRAAPLTLMTMVGTLFLADCLMNAMMGSAFPFIAGASGAGLSGMGRTTAPPVLPRQPHPLPKRSKPT